MPDTLQRWRENKKIEQELDPEYEEFLKTEKQEIDEAWKYFDTPWTFRRVYRVWGLLAALRYLLRGE